MSLASPLKAAAETLAQRWELWGDQARERRMALRVAAAAPQPAGAPVVFFNASTRLSGLSLNAAYSLLTAWSLRLQGVPVVHLVPRFGFDPCILGTNRDRVTDDPPCAVCIAQSEALYAGANVRWFEFAADPALEQALEGLGVPDLAQFTHHGMPLGPLALPSVRWILRRYNLFDDEPTRTLYRRYLLSAWNAAQEAGRLFDAQPPRAVVVFNGTFYPEAAVRWAARARAIPVLAHETAFQPYSVFFTPGEATAYPIEIPPGTALTDAQNTRLDETLAQRFQGNFTMGGIRFWPQMHGLDDALEQRIARAEGVVPVFTNVVFDTSQGHANVIFPDMFAWLDDVLAQIRSHPELLFVIRAHPDEGRPGKSSLETVRDWVARAGAAALPNVVFIDSHEYLSSYALIAHAIEGGRPVLAYNSSIGIEAAVLGARVLCGGKVKYNLPHLPTVEQPATRAAFAERLAVLLDGRQPPAPAEYAANARVFLYYQLFRTSLSFARYLAPGRLPGFARLADFDPADLLPERSPTLRVISDGILRGAPFLTEEN